jgi:hypothetical protein
LGHVPRALSRAARCCSRVATAARSHSATTRGRRTFPCSSSRRHLSNQPSHMLWMRPDRQLRLHWCAAATSQARLSSSCCNCNGLLSRMAGVLIATTACCKCAVGLSAPVTPFSDKQCARRQQRRQPSCRQGVSPAAHRAMFWSSAGAKAPTN